MVAMEDDFNTAYSNDILFDLCREINSGIAAFSKQKYFAEALAEPGAVDSFAQTY